MDKYLELEEDLTKLYQISQILLLIGGNKDTVPEEVANALYYLSGQMNQTLEILSRNLKQS